jgi:hypothetical protein
MVILVYVKEWGVLQDNHQVRMTTLSGQKRLSLCVDLASSPKTKGIMGIVQLQSTTQLAAVGLLTENSLRNSGSLLISSRTCPCMLVIDVDDCGT